MQSTSKQWKIINYLVRVSPSDIAMIFIFLLFKPFIDSTGLLHCSCFYPHSINICIVTMSMYACSKSNETKEQKRSVLVRMKTGDLLSVIEVKTKEREREKKLTLWWLNIQFIRTFLRLCQLYNQHVHCLATPCLHPCIDTNWKRV